MAALEEARMLSEQLRPRTAIMKISIAILEHPDLKMPVVGGASEVLEVSAAA